MRGKTGKDTNRDVEPRVKDAIRRSAEGGGGGGGYPAVIIPTIDRLYLSGYRQNAPYWRTPGATYRLLNRACTRQR